MLSVASRGLTAVIDTGAPGVGLLSQEANTDQMFPMLTPVQIERIAVYGRRRPIQYGQVLIESAAEAMPFFVVTRGQVEIVRLFGVIESLVVRHGPGQFTGEIQMLSGRRSLARARVSEAGEVIEVDHKQLLTLVQTDAELGDIIMRAYILRRIGLIAHGLGDAVLIGSVHCAATLRIKEFLTRNGYPYSYLDLDRDMDVLELMDKFQVSAEDLPILICRGEIVLKNPSNQAIADSLGFNDAVDQTRTRDVVVVGAGPGGLAAAVYAASEGLDVLVIETNAPGGQAGSSSKIENYLGFPMGISGQELTDRAYTQAQKFGTQMVIAKGAMRLSCDRKPYSVEIGKDQHVPARAIIVATGAEYRKPVLENTAKFEGAGIYYAATFVEAKVTDGEEVIVVGGGNSAGQAAVFLAQTAKRVYMLVRSNGLSRSMSRYLIRRIEGNPKIELHALTELAAFEGAGHLERVRWQDSGTGNTEVRDIRHVFFMAGAVPGSQWLDDCIVLDRKGFIKTGLDLSQEELAEAQWPLARQPYLLETSLPGVFAVGDIRCDSIKRVAAAVGEGSTAIAFVHKVLQE